MGSEAEEEEERPEALKLALFSNPNLITTSPPHSGTLTPPLHTLASVPFQWEELPGKPFPCTTLSLTTTPTPTIANPHHHHHTSFKSLDLPPRLFNDAKITKTPSPTNVLEGPYKTQVGGRSSSFRFLIRKRRQQQGSFDGGTKALSCGDTSPDRGSLLGAMVLSSTTTSSNNIKKDKGLFGSWRKKGDKTEVLHGGNSVFSSFSDDGTGSCDDIGGSTMKKVRMRRKRSLSPPKFHFWATIYGALKQVMPRRSTKWRKDGL